MDLRKRLTGLLVDPKREWSIIAGEPADVVWLYRHFIAIVAAIPAAALFLRFTLAASPIVGLGAAVARYIIALATPMLVAVVVEKLAPKFRSSGGTAQALRLVAYSAAPAWVAGVFYLLPGAGATATLVGLLYGIYLFALGLPRLMHTPREQLVPFMLVCALVLLAVNILLTLVVSGARAV
jgi:Yip1-like protein